MANKVPRALTKQIENFEEIVKSLNGLIDGSKIKLEHYDPTFLEKLTEIRKEGLALRDRIQVFKNALESSVTQEYEGSSRFAAARVDLTMRNMKAAERVIAAHLTRKESF